MLEQEPYYSPTLLQIANFISNYYFCPLGRVLALIAPRFLTTSKVEQEAEDTPPRIVSRDAPPLTTAQQQALQAIQQCGDSKPVLLHGVTDSGKTEVYLHLIATLLNAASHEPAPQFLVMVPEIALTGQMVRVFTQRFPEQVVVAHSRAHRAATLASLSPVACRQTFGVDWCTLQYFCPFCQSQVDRRR